jgi:hypothetical protein
MYHKGENCDIYIIYILILSSIKGAQTQALKIMEVEDGARQKKKGFRNIKTKIDLDIIY